MFFHLDWQQLKTCWNMFFCHAIRCLWLREIFAHKSNSKRSSTGYRNMALPCSEQFRRSAEDVSIQNTYWLHSHWFQCHCKQRAQVAWWCGWQSKKTPTSLIHRPDPQMSCPACIGLLGLLPLPNRCMCEQGWESHGGGGATSSETNSGWLTTCKNPPQHVSYLIPRNLVSPKYQHDTIYNPLSDRWVNKAQGPTGGLQRRVCLRCCKQD